MMHRLLLPCAGLLALTACSGPPRTSSSAPAATDSAGVDRHGPFPPRTYACRFTPVPLTIDGTLEPAWDRAPWSQTFIDIEGDRKPLPYHDTRLRMLWDHDYLYVSAYLVETDLWATLTERDSVIYYDNDFEVFVDPDHDTHDYAELELNAFNTVWDLMLVKPYRNGGPARNEYDIAGLKTAVHLDGTVNNASDTDTGWTVEIAIPWSAFAELTDVPLPPETGDRWRMNFSRVHWDLEVAGGLYRKQTDPDTGESLPEYNWVWSAQREIAMHEPEYWGIVEFRPAHDRRPVTITDEDTINYRVRAWRTAQDEQRDDALPWSVVDRRAPHPAGWSWPPEEATDGDAVLTVVTHPDGRRYELREDSFSRIILPEAP